VNSDPKIHWYGIFNSVVIVGILSIIVGVIVLRTINRDIETYNDIDKVQESHDEITGWKLVHGDIFRSPPQAHIFAPLVNLFAC
jgi:transmembrane 9 superfamily member 2/4